MSAASILNVVVQINKNSLEAKIYFYEHIQLKEVMYLKWTGYPTYFVYKSDCSNKLFFTSNDPTVYNFKLPLNQSDIYRFCAKPKRVPSHAPTNIIIIATCVISGSLVFVVSCFYIIRRLVQDRESFILPKYIKDDKEACWPSIVELMVVYAYGDQKFDIQTLFSRTAEVSYHIIGKTGSWQEMLHTFNIKPQLQCFVLVTSTYLQEVTKFWEESFTDKETLDQVMLFHLSHRTVPILIGDVNVEDFPESLSAVYFKLNLQRWLDFPADGAYFQDMLQQVYAR